VRVAVLANFRSVGGEAKANLSVLSKTDVEVRQYSSARSLLDIVSWADIIVDAMLGVGLSSPLKGFYAQTVDLVNASGKPVVAIDIPTGIDADTGAVLGTAIKADLTITMALMKRGLVSFPGASFAGEVRVADLGIPPEVIDQEKIDLLLLGKGWISSMMTQRQSDSHKGDFGHLMVVAGSPGKAGAAIMAAKSALRTGAGLVSVAAPNQLVPIIQSSLMEAMCVPSDESMEGTLGAGSEEEILKNANARSACALGPGLSTHFETAQVIRNLIQRITVPMVIDADALNAVSGHTEILKRAKAPIILTPHPGEMGRLLHLSPADVQKNRIDIATGFSRKYNVTLVLKGAGTVVALPDGRAFVNTSGNPGMATAGIGDVLTGMIGSLLAQGYTSEQAACLGVYLHGHAGDLAAKEKGETGMIAGDVIEKIPAAIKEMIN
jgi:NAD(P)H-hydrate epimerase